MGLFAAFYAGMRELNTLVLEALPRPGGQLTALYPKKYIYDVGGHSAVLARDLVQELWKQGSQFGAIGFEGRWDYGAIGTVTNLAARLCGEARPGEILISPQLLDAVEELIEVEPVGELTLKGFHRPIPTHNALRLKA